MFGRAKKMKPAKQIVFALIVGFGVITFWRGIWGLLDEYLFPENLSLSYWVSAVIGFLILFATHHVTKELSN